MAEKTAPHDRFGVSKSYWDNLSSEHRGLYERVRPLRIAAYKVDHQLTYVEKALESFKNDAERRGGKMELNPDFQRGHVWSEAKQIAYVENIFRGSAPMGIRFNSSGWDSLSETGEGDLLGADIVCVDGLQRLTAIRRFIAGEICVFGGESAESLRGTPFDPFRFRFSVEVFSIKNRAELLQFYLDINRGGVVHTDEEIERVERLLAEVKAGNWEKPKLAPNAEIIAPVSTALADSATDEAIAKKTPARKKPKSRG